MSRRHLGAADDPALAGALGEASGWLTANVRARRHARGLTQQALAESVGTETTYIARIEGVGSRVNVSLVFLVALARALGCMPHDLLRPARKPRRRAPGRPKPAARLG